MKKEIDILILLCQIFNDGLEEFINDIERYSWMDRGRFRMREDNIKNNNILICQDLNNFYNGDWVRFVKDYICREEDEVKFRNDRIDYFFKYLIKHKSKKNKILILLKKIKSLGFDSIGLDEDAVFTNKIYAIETKPKEKIFRCYYLANMRAFLTYEGTLLCYTTDDSPYSICCYFEKQKNSRLYDLYDYYIDVNSLTFDPNLLPTIIDKKNIYNKILALRNKNYYEKTDIITNAVDLRFSLDDMQQQFAKLSQITEPNEYRKVLEEYKELLNRFAKLSKWYDEYAIKETGISEERLSSEQIEQLGLQLTREM